MVNQIRTFLLERGSAVRQGLRSLRQALPDILAKRTDVLTPRIVRLGGVIPRVQFYLWSPRTPRQREPPGTDWGLR